MAGKSTIHHWFSSQTKPPFTSGIFQPCLMKPEAILKSNYNQLYILYTISGWWFQLLWKILVHWDYYSQYNGKIKNVSVHQPVYTVCIIVYNYEVDVIVSAPRGTVKIALASREMPMCTSNSASTDASNMPKPCMVCPIWKWDIGSTSQPILNGIPKKMKKKYVWLWEYPQFIRKRASVVFLLKDRRHPQKNDAGIDVRWLGLRISTKMAWRITTINQYYPLVN